MLAACMACRLWPDRLSDGLGRLGLPSRGKAKDNGTRSRCVQTLRTRHPVRWSLRVQMSPGHGPCLLPLRAEDAFLFLCVCVCPAIACVARPSRLRVPWELADGSTICGRAVGVASCHATHMVLPARELRSLMRSVPGQRAALARGALRRGGRRRRPPRSAACSCASADTAHIRRP